MYAGSARRSLKFSSEMATRSASSPSPSLFGGVRAQVITDEMRISVFFSGFSFPFSCSSHFDNAASAASALAISACARSEQV